MQPAGVPYDTTRERSADVKSNEGPPTRINKARGILGMDVRNQNDEHLGHIKDFVIDWKTEQVSYAVISTAPKAALGAGGKLLAVPLAALTPSADHKYLILNADKSKVQAASGFSWANWPNVGNPSWGAQPFWQQDATTPAGREPPTRQPGTQPQQNMTPGASPVPSPESNSSEPPATAPQPQSPPKSDAAPESSSPDDSIFDPGSDSDTGPAPSPDASSSPSPAGK